MKCVYVINTGKHRTPVLTENLLRVCIAASFAENWDLLKEKMNNPVFSLADNQKLILDSAKGKAEAKEALILKTGGMISDSEYSFGNAISAIHFIEKEFPLLGGIRAAVNEGDFIKWVKESQIKAFGMSESERDTLAHEIVKSWRLIEKDSIDLHNAMPILWNYINDPVKFRNALINFKGVDGDNSLYKKLYNTLPGQTIDGVSLLYNQMREINAKLNTLAKVEEEKSTLYAGLHFSAKIKNQMERVGVHVDKLYVDSEGNLHVVNFKFCLSDPSTWCENKVIKYQYEMAMIKRILLQNGLDVKNATFVNIPIVLSYDGENIANIRIPNTSTNGMEPYNVRASKNGYITSPIAQKEPEIEKYFEAPKIKLDPIKMESKFELSTLFMKVLNPETDITDEGLRISAKEWIRLAVHDGNIVLDHDKQQYKIILPSGEEKYVDGSITDPYRNEDILKTVRENIEDLSKESPIIMSELVKAIKNSYQRGNTSFVNVRGFKFNQEYIRSSLSKYFNKVENEKGEEEYEWELLSEADKNNPLANRGILLFLNKRTKQLDTIVASSFFCKALIPMKRGQTNICGYYTMDLGSPSTMKASYGNMELLRAASILNEIKGELPENIKFGSIKIITPNNTGEGYWREAKTVMDEFSKICRFLNNQSPENKFKSNFKLSDFVNTLGLIFDVYDDIVNGGSSTEKANISFNLEGLKTAHTISGLITAIEELITAIEDSGKIGHTPEEIIANLHSADSTRKGIATIYSEAVKFLNYHTGFKLAQVLYISKFERYVMPQYANSDENVRHINGLYTKALDKVASNFQRMYNPLRAKLFDFYDKKGFTATRQKLGADARAIFEKFYEVTPDGKKTWRFVNPYDVVASRNLDADEKRMLKLILFHLNKVRSSLTSSKGTFDFNETDINSARYMLFIEDHKNTFFLVPLEKKGGDIRTSVELRVKNTKDVFHKLEKEGGKEVLKDIMTRRQRRLFEDGKSKKDESIYDMSVENHIALSETPDYRTRLLKQHEDDYFETNIEYLLIDYMESAAAREELNKVALYGRCMLFQMALQGDTEGKGTLNLLRKSAEDIEDFIKLNVFNKSLLDDLSEQFVNFIEPARRLMTDLYISYNLRSAMRDTFEGIWLNFSRTITHYQNDLKAGDVVDAYKEVVLNVFKSDRSLNICSELCLRYRLSNVDAARISERAKSGKGGLNDPKSMGFSTLRTPDFLNRMVLFVAQCKHDGVWDAFDMQDDALVYNWKKDKRFSIYAQGLKSHPKYKEQLALYYNAIDLYNKDHGTQISFTDPKGLPEPYSQDEISRFKEFANKIYGAYDKSQKSKYEHIALGMTFGVFSTWFNGHTAAWFARKGFYDPYYTNTDEKGNLLIKRNEAGHELWFGENQIIYEKHDDGKFYDLETGELVELNLEEIAPVIAKVPVMVQGIAYTLKDIYNNVMEDGLSKESFMKNIWAYKCNRENLLKAGWDALMVMLFFALFSLLITPAYNEHKKKKDSDNIIADGCIELFYKAGVNSYDGFLGPIAVANYVLNNTEPSAPNVSLKILKDLGKLTFGDKSMKSFVYGYLPIFRTFKDTAKIASGGSFNVSD